MTDDELELRCFCSSKTLLAVCGRDSKSRQPFVHIKTWKGSRLYVEVVIESGKARIRCRKCLRWFTVRIRLDDVDMKTERLPDSIHTQLV
jgi:hypothetical protein